LSLPSFTFGRRNALAMKVSVHVHNDHLERISKVRKPVLAVAELIWNGLDADATEVRVDFEHNALGGLELIRVTDNGSGIPHPEAAAAFGNLGGSHKRGALRSRSRKRLMHGKAGKGRFRAFFLGSSVEWATAFRSNGSVSGFRIIGSRLDLGTFDIQDPKPAASQTGTEVEIRGIQKKRLSRCLRCDHEFQRNMTSLGRQAQ